MQRNRPRIAANGGLGRSDVYLRLLRYLADAALEGKSLKELDVATDVLRKHDYNPASDAAARVYMHNLRRKLDEFYTADGDNRSHRLVAGLRDEGLMQAASIVSDPVTAPQLGVTVVSESTKIAFEALFRVSGFDRTYVGGA